MTLFCRSLILMLLTAVLLGSTRLYAEAEQTITFATVTAEETLVFQQLEALYREAFRRLGYDFTLISRPPERALLDANAGNIDGEGGRLFELNKFNDYPNLIRVEESIIDTVFAAFTMNPDIQVDGWESLKGTDWLIGYYRGIKTTERNLPLYVEEENLVSTTDAEESCRMLVAGRIDLFIDTVATVSTLIETRKEYRTIRNAGTVQDISGYAYMHVKHQNLALQLAATLKAMKADGTYQRLVERVAQKMREKKE